MQVQTHGFHWDPCFHIRCETIDISTTSLQHLESDNWPASSLCLERSVFGWSRKLTHYIVFKMPRYSNSRKENSSRQFPRDLKTNRKQILAFKKNLWWWVVSIFLQNRSVWKIYGTTKNVDFNKNTPPCTSDLQKSRY